MINRYIVKFILFVILLTGFSYSQGETAEILPKPNINNDNSFLTLLTKRKSCRSFSQKEISRKKLSEILWAAYGVADTLTRKRTVPSAYAGYEISVYAVTKNGLYLYLPYSHSIKLISNEDLRKYAGIQGFVAEAPLTLIYAADFEKMRSVLTEEKKIFLSAANTGFIAQNVYLYCASTGLGTVVRDLINRELLAEKMGISNGRQSIILAQTIGYPEAGD